jgi:hypothetical protein
MLLCIWFYFCCFLSYELRAVELISIICLKFTFDSQPIPWTLFKHFVSIWRRVYLCWYEITGVIILRLRYIKKFNYGPLLAVYLNLVFQLPWLSEGARAVRFWVRISGRVKRLFSLVKVSKPVLGSTQPSYTIGTGGFLPLDKAAGAWC